MELYHVLNRGIDGRKLFCDSQDYARFVHDLYEFNDIALAMEFSRRKMPETDVGFRKPYSQKRKRKQLVEIHGWYLAKNHYHLLISELAENGLVRFMTKVNIGYANYYNERYKRRGHLFQGKTKKILIAHQEHFLYILHYLHLNALDNLPCAGKWRERDKGAISDIPKVLEHLKKYRWSSYLDYCGTRNFPSILTTSLFSDALGTNYISSLKEYLSDRMADELDQKSLEY